MIEIKELNEKIKSESVFIEAIKKEMSQVIIGQKHMVNNLLIALLTNGHILLEGVPGLAKTLAVTSLAKIINAKFSRIQFTPDLLPADLIGTMIYSHKTEEFVTKKGPLFANFILADEINRSPAKVQSALLEAMQEKQITIGEKTYILEKPFLVLATQNPIEQEGTYPLPEAQTDRFMLKVIIDYPKIEEEKLIIRQNISKKLPETKSLISTDDILKASNMVKDIYLDEKIEKYIVDIVFASRNPSDYGLSEYENLISFGGSPRAGINMALASKAFAFIQHRGVVFPEDVRAICKEVMRHRIGLTYEAEAENITSEDIISGILNKIKVP